MAGYSIIFFGTYLASLQHSTVDDENKISLQGKAGQKGKLSQPLSTAHSDVSATLSEHDSGATREGAPGTQGHLDAGIEEGPVGVLQD